MDEYRGLEFKTNKGINCIVVKDELNDNYIIVNINKYEIISRCGYENIKECITNIKNKY